MTHEFKTIVNRYQKAAEGRLKAILATVVALEGSSYRRPGVRMLILENGEIIGAVSGGCVEKEVWRQATSVFNTNTPKVMVYDGRYRLGCEGILYILLEPFAPDTDFFKQFEEILVQRKPFNLISTFRKEHTEDDTMGSVFQFGEEVIPLRPNTEKLYGEIFEQQLSPCFQLIIIGAEHDAVQLCKHASLMGWEVTVVTNPREEKTADHFPGVHRFLQQEPEAFNVELDQQTAVVLMTHSFVKDFGFLTILKDKQCAYLGLLGPALRREKLFDELLERYPDTSERFLDSVHGPAGLSIGAETPQEITISIISEILAVTRRTIPMPLREKLGKIHN